MAAPQSGVFESVAANPYSGVANWHMVCFRKGVVGSQPDPAGGKDPTGSSGSAATHHHQLCGEYTMWTKPEAEVVAVTMEVTAYVATL